jgi:hypothetical protein
VNQNFTRFKTKPSPRSLYRPIHPLFETPPYGIYARVARETSVSTSFARKVALGLFTSKRVADALLAEANRITRRLRKATEAA